MSLIKCSECGREISDKAEACPLCGNPIHRQVVGVDRTVEIKHSSKKWGKKIWGLTLFLIGLAIPFLFGHESAWLGLLLILVGMWIGISGRIRQIILGLLLFVLVGGYFVLQYQSSHYTGPGTFIGNLNQDLFKKDYKRVLDDLLSQQTNPPSNPPSNKSKEIPLQQVNNLGYTFYVGQIDNSDAASISDTIKNDITRVIYNSRLPKSILEKTPIIFVNNLALKPEQYVALAGKNFKVMDFGTGFLYEGGIYATYESGQAIIYLNKEALTKAPLNDILTHELGHAIGGTLTDGDWVEYYKLRNISPSTSRNGGLWNLSPQEDFAEVYKNMFTGLDVRTYYGLLVPTLGESYNGEGIFEISCAGVYREAYQGAIDAYEKSNPPKDCSKVTDFMEKMWCDTSSPYTTSVQQEQAKGTANASVRVQNCRRDVMTNSSKYPDEFRYGIPYKGGAAGPKTKEFINAVINRFN